jgi:putative flippase GtrA
MASNKRDLVFSLITGLTAGTIAWRILEYLDKPTIIGFPAVGLVILVPILWYMGVNFGYFLGRWMPFFNQFGKFVAIGFTNFAVDLGIFNLLFAFSQENSEWTTLFKACSFVIAALHSYLWNKNWSFNAGSSRGGGMEFFKFILVSVLSLLVNVGVFTLLSQGHVLTSGISQKVWLNLASIAGSAAALVFSFVGFRLLVFNNK